MEENKTYELGYLLTPLLPEEGVPEALEKLVKSVIVRHGGVFTVETAPKMIALAYPIRKRIENKNQVFRDAYFGAIRFTALPEAAPAIAADLKKVNELVRVLLIIIPDIKEEPPRRPPTDGKRVEEAPAGEADSPSEKVEDPVDAGEAIDKEINNLLNVSK